MAIPRRNVDRDILEQITSLYREPVAEEERHPSTESLLGSAPRYGSSIKSQPKYTTKRSGPRLLGKIIPKSTQKVGNFLPPNYQLLRTEMCRYSTRCQRKNSPVEPCMFAHSIDELREKVCEEESCNKKYCCRKHQSREAILKSILRDDPNASKCERESCDGIWTWCSKRHSLSDTDLIR
jgi:hypothetical protein